MTDLDDRSEGLVLLVEDEADIRALTTRWLEGQAFDVEPVASAEEAFEALAHVLPDVVCLDLGLPGMSGMEALERLRRTHPRIPVVILTADREVDSVVGAMQAGAYEYLAKPLDKTKLLTVVGNASEKHRLELRVARLEREVTPADGYGAMIGRSRVMKSVFREIDRVAASDVTVLIRGESGTGKELVAQALHDEGGRAKGPFVAINCAAIPENLQESELFGHERGAFTGALQRRRGRFEQAHGGTLFLDEVAELSPALQAKLLRVLQQRSFHRVGGSEEIHVDFRLVAASHRSLADEVASGRFREDLFFRLAVFELDLPPLRERGDDVFLIAQHLLTRMELDSLPSLSDAVRGVFRGYGWPGNVRELENALRRAAVVCREGVIQPDDLPRRILEDAGPEAPPPPSAAEPAPAAERPMSMDELEKRALVDALERADGNVAEVVRQLGIGRTTVYRKLKKYGLR
ncbi:MAG: sigma-54 dependent transcriptional regulator [Myxococcota bacterium]